MSKLISAILIPIGLLATTLCQITPCYATATVVSAKIADTLKYEVVAKVVGTPQEDEITFLKRASLVIHQYSDANSFEYCANIARQVSTDFYGKEQTVYAVNITTNFSHLACVSKDIYPPGFNLIGKSIHSHGKGGTFEVNYMDTQLSTVLKNRGFRMGGDVNHFSSTDFKHPGYLVTADHLLYQDGIRGKDGVIDYGTFR